MSTEVRPSNPAVQRPLSAHQWAALVTDLALLADRLVDAGDEHGEVKILKAAATLLNAQQDEIERQRAALETAALDRVTGALPDPSPYARAICDFLRPHVGTRELVLDERAYSDLCHLVYDIMEQNPPTAVPWSHRRDALEAAPPAEMDIEWEKRS
jgi:hypothetical protein